MLIRKAREEDIGRILQLLVQVNNVHNRQRPDLFMKDSTKYTKEELKDILNREDTPVFVAVDDDDFVTGYAFGVMQSHLKDNNIADIVTFYIDDICVDEQFRHQHIGKDLFEYVKNYAAEAGCYNITLNVWENNNTARHFYENCGFHVQKTGMEVILSEDPSGDRCHEL